MYQTRLDVEYLPEGVWLGTSPDLPGLIVQAGSPEEVIALAPEIASDLIEVMRETDQPLPPRVEPPICVSVLVNA
jgi:predicted RNase H-like HicB family nuclease